MRIGSARYAPAMSRTSVENNSAYESFAGLLDRLTQDESEEDPYGHPDVHSGSRSAGSEARRAAAPARTRPLAPVAKATKGGGHATWKGSELSYEKALQIHRRKRPEAGSEPEPGNEIPRIPDRKDNGHASGDGAKDRVSTTASVRGASSSQIRAASRAQVQTGVKARAESPRAQSSRAQSSRGLSGALEARRSRFLGPESVMRGSSTSTRQAAIRSAMMARSQAVSRAAEEFGSAFDERLDDVLGAENELTVQRNAERASLPVTGERSLAGQIVHRSLEIDPRRSVISVRLNDAELLQLRDRAAECGISVSAYMRSCVLDAEHLRAQVKQALAEMRSSTGSRGSTQLQLPLGPERSGATNGSLSRLLARSAQFLLGSWLIFGRRE
jgi:hypothetical protein